MTIEKRLSALVNTGSIIEHQSLGANSVQRLPIHAQIVRLTDGTQLLYYVEAGAEDQHHTHAIVFDRVAEVHRRDLDFTWDGRRVAYLAPFSEWPEVNAQKMGKQLSAAVALVTADDKVRRRFSRFVEACKPVASARFTLN